MTAPQDPIAPQDPADLPAVAAKLIETIAELTEAIQDLLRRTARSETHIRVMWGVVGVVVFLAGGMSALFYQQSQTNARLDDTRSGVLCPLYSVFLGSYNPSTRAPGTDRDTYEATFAVIRDGYKDLGCTTPLVPPATSRSNPPPK